MQQELSNGSKCLLGMTVFFVAGSAVATLITLGALGYFSTNDPQPAPALCVLSSAVGTSGCSIDKTSLCNMGASEFTASTFACNWGYGKLAKGEGVNLSSYVKGFDNAWTLASGARCVHTYDVCHQPICCTNISNTSAVCTSTTSLCNPNLQPSKWAIPGNIVACVTSSPADLCIGCGVNCELFVYGQDHTRIDNITCLGNQSYHFANESALCGE